MDRLFRLEEAARMLGVSSATIRLWEWQGKIRCARTPGGRRCVPESEIRRIRGDALPQKETVVALYVRVSSYDQKAKGDLERQEARLREAVRALGLPEPTYVVRDVASGLSDRRRGLLRLMDMAERKMFTDLAITYRDRLTRFGYRYLEEFFTRNGVRIHVVNGEEDRRSVQEELVADLLAIVTSFSGKLYGLRSPKNARKLVAAVKEAVRDAGDL